jgi:hypothetical protein
MDVSTIDPEQVDNELDSHGYVLIKETGIEQACLQRASSTNPVCKLPRLTRHESDSIINHSLAAPGGN